MNNGEVGSVRLFSSMACWLARGVHPRACGLVLWSSFCRDGSPSRRQHCRSKEIYNFCHWQNLNLRPIGLPNFRDQFIPLCPFIFPHFAHAQFVFNSRQCDTDHNTFKISNRPAQTCPHDRWSRSNRQINCIVSMRRLVYHLPQVVLCANVLQHAPLDRV